MPDYHILEFEQVHKRYGSNKVLRGVSFAIKRGEICGLVGANGAGKTTIMRLALELMKPDAGQISLRTAQKGNAGCLIEEPRLDKSLTVFQNLEAHRRLAGMRREDLEHMADIFKLHAFLHKPARACSQGMRQKAALALALMGYPELVLLDEPVNGLDPRGVKEVRDIIVRANAEQGTTFMISSHLIDELVKVVHSCLFLANGVVSYKNIDAADIENAFFEGGEAAQ